MASSELYGLDVPACPLLGLADDRRSHFTYPNAGHRCFASKHPLTTDPGRQATYCLGDYPTCDRYQARQRKAQGSERPQSSPVTRQASPPPRLMPDQPAGAPVAGAFGPGTVVHVYRDGDSLARIARKYGLTVEQLATANGLKFDASVADGTRLVIPLDPRSVRAPRARPTRTAER